MSAPPPVEPVSLRELTRDPVEEKQLSRNWREIQRRRLAKPGHRALRRAVVVGGLAAAAAALLFVFARSDVGALTLADGSAFTSVSPGITVLDDGSSIDLEDGGTLELLESSAQRVVLRLAEGRARFSVTPNGPRRWVIEAGARVEVVGTVFTVDRRGGRVGVAVERGIVLVFHEQLADGVRRLTAGQDVTVGDAVARGAVGASAGETATGSATATEAAGATATDTASATDTETATATETATDTAGEDATATATDTATDSEAATGRGSVSEAARSGRRAESVSEVPAVPTATELINRADNARGHGDWAAAALWYEQVYTRYPSSSDASIAALTLGNIELRRLRRPDRAVRAFDRALRAGLPASLAEDARAHRVEALMRAGRADQARHAAAEYHRRYPSGRWTQEVDRWIP